MNSKTYDRTTHTHTHMVTFSRLMTLLFQRRRRRHRSWRAFLQLTMNGGSIPKWWTGGAGHDQAMFLMAQLSAFPEWVLWDTIPTPTTHAHSRRWMASISNYSGQLRPIKAEESHSKGFGQTKAPRNGRGFLSRARARFRVTRSNYSKIDIRRCTAWCSAAAFVAATTWSAGHRTYVTVRKRYTSLY